MTHAMQDLRFAARQLTHQPVFAFLFIVTLALGVGAATTCFSVLNAVALRPIPFPDPDRLVAINLAGPHGSGRAPLTLNGFRALTEIRGVFSGYAAYVPETVTVAAAGTAERVPAGEITGDIFSVLGVPVQMGRPILPADAGSRVAVVGNEYAARVFGSAADALGTTILVNGDAHVVVGVTRAGFSFPEDSRVWLPLAVTAPDRTVVVIARMQPGVSAAEADAAARAASAGVSIAPAAAERRDWMVATAPLREIMIGTKQRDMALFIIAAAALVLLIACANLAGLLTAHLSARKHEIAVRAAIGARRLRIVQQLMTESVMLALAGGMLGVLLAEWGVAVFAATLGKPHGADWIEITVDSRVLLFALIASLLTALLFGLAPAIRGSRADLRNALQEDRGAAGAQGRGHRARYLLVAGQVALSIGLVSGAAAIVTSSMRFGNLDIGFNRDRLLVLRVALENRAYDHPEQRLAFVDAVVGRLRALSGVASATVTSHVPLADRDVPGARFILEGTTTLERPVASVRFIDAGYLSTLAIPVHRGRAFTAAEARDLRPQTAIINDTMARRYWPDREPVGARIRLMGGPDVTGWYTVVGVAGNVAQRQLPAVPENQIYLPLSPAREMTVVVRAASDPASLAPSAREAVRAVDSSLAVDMKTMSAAYALYVNDRRLQGLVLGTIGAIAVLIAALGVYGVVSLMVSERRRELAIRTALGASRTAVMRLVLARGLSLATVGIGAGLGLAMALTAFLSSVFLGVRAFDVLVFGSTAVLIGGVALVASWWPARRAMRIDPIVALKE
ncbi:MAG TPA: ABC transporter permease [Vicinamibacterales bacterium]|jgi:predicted permease